MSNIPEHADSWSELETLLLACLERPEAERGASVEALCAQHPEHADGLRRRYAMLLELGFVGGSHCELETGATFGSYRLRRRLGSGAMGIVYLAEHQSTNRQVALKVLRPEFLDEPRARERFRREVQAAARLEHPGICPIYDAGEVGSRPYLAMRYVGGESLATAIAATRNSNAGSTVVLDAADRGRLADQRLDLARIASATELVEKIARALHAAHEVGLIHRDVKPANIILTPQHEPVLVDFGLARDDLRATLTLSTDTLGTPAYMAPEQIEPRGRRTDRRTDVYALGAVLFECLTLRTPYQAASREALYRQILVHDAPDPREWSRSIPFELALVIQKALEKEPGCRYESAHDFAEDLRRYRAREPVRARPPSRALRLRRWVQRNPALAGALATAFLCLGAGLAVALVLLANARRMLAERQATDVAALSMRALAHDATLATWFAQRASELEPENPATVSALYAAVAELREETIRELPWPYCIAGAADGSYFVVGSDQTARAWIFRPDAEPVELATHAAGHYLLHRVVVSRDGARILVVSVGAQQSPTEPSTGGLATVWDPNQPHQPLMRMPHPGEVLDGCFPAAGSVLTTCSDGVARLWSKGSNDARELRGHLGPISSCAASPDGQLLVTGGHDCTVRRWDAVTGTQLGEPIPHGGSVVAIDFAPACPGRMDRFVTATGHDSLRAWRDDPGFADDRARVFDREGKIVAELGRHASRIERARFSPDGRHIVTAGADYKAKLWHVADDGAASLVKTVDHDGVIYGCCFDASGELVATVTFSGTTYLWAVSHETVAMLRGHRVCATGCIFHRDQLVTTALDHTVRTWSTDSGLVPSWSADQLYAATYGGDERWVIAAEQRGIVHVWERATPSRKVVPSFDTGIRNLAAIACTSEQLVIGDEDGELHSFRFQGEPCGPPVRAHAGRMGPLQFSPADPSLLLTSGRDGVVRLWTIRSSSVTLRAELAAFPIARHGAPSLVSGTANHPVWIAAFSPNGQQIAVATDDPKRTVKLWRVDAILEGRDQSPIVLGHHDSIVRSLAFARDSGHIACATLHGSLWLWHIPSRTGGRILQLERDVTSTALSPDGTTIGCGLMDGTVHVLGGDGSLKYVLPKPAQPGRVKGLQFLGDGSRLLVSARPGLIREWTVGPAELIARLRVRGLARSPTPDENQQLAEVLGR
jgi:serine/threonine protein kinase/WD40 repeat protein